ncbi:hypothetical protein [uncultured Psychroserpens sp.]|uniref:hypothetical protein n=1 Tax=uncultured Psychroserpens sp. TaxID=255436 RepID=UPI00262A7729|nr:hypothetical protein [uncultured Psychroserpens sp.]
MDLVNDNTIKTYENDNQDLFFMLLKNQKIEEAINRYIDDYLEVNYNNKQRFIPKQTWVKYIKKTILNNATEVVQFKIEKAKTKNEMYMFKIFMICKKMKGTFDLTEIQIGNLWNNNYINKLHFKLTNY